MWLPRESSKNCDRRERKNGDICTPGCPPLCIDARSVKGSIEHIGGSILDFLWWFCNRVVPGMHFTTYGLGRFSPTSKYFVNLKLGSQLAASATKSKSAGVRGYIHRRLVKKVPTT